MMESTYSVNKELPKEAKKYNISPAVEGAVLGFFALLLTFITAYFIYSNSMAVLEEEIKDGLMRMVSGMAACIDGDVLETFTDPKDVSRKEYQDMVALIQKARIGTKHCSYLYINTIKDDKVYFIIDPVSIDENGKPIYTDAASLEPSIPMTPYEDADEDLIRKAFFEGKSVVTQDSYDDRWGTFYSAYAPIYNSKRQIVCTLGADLRINELLDRCSPMVDATKRAFIVSVSLALLLGTFVWFSRRFTFMLNESRQSIYKNFLVAKRFADQTSFSIGKQFQRTSSILKYISQKLLILSKFEKKETIVNNILIEKEKIERFADKLLTLGELKYSKREKDLVNFSILEVNQNIIKKIKNNKFFNEDDSIDYNIDKDIPEILYGSVISYEELIGHIYELCLNQLGSSVYSKTLLLEERSKDVLLRQTFAVSKDDISESRLKLAEAICRNISSENWGEQLELSESINIPIIQELLFILGTEIKAESKDGYFKINFDFVLLKSQETDSNGE